MTSTSHCRSARRLHFVGSLMGAIRYAFWRLVTVMCVVLAVPQGAYSWSQFANDIQFPNPPKTAQEAKDTLAARREAIARFGACGDEMDFKQKVIETPDNPGGAVPMIIAKMLWLLIDHPPGESPKFPTTTPGQDTTSPGGDPNLKHHDDPEDLGIGITRIQLTTVPAAQEQPCRSPAKMPNTQMADINTEMARLYGRACSDVIVGGEFIITPECMRAQINEALRRVQVKGQLGSSEVPCYMPFKNFPSMPPFKKIVKTEGEWDVTVRDLTRVFYLNNRFPERQILSTASVKHIQEDLLTADGAPGLTGYSPFYECGNQEKSTGSAQERLARRNWLSDTFDDVLGAAKDVWDWIKDRIPLPDWLKKILAAVLLTVAGVPPWLEPLLELGTVDLVNVRVPETENHLLNIETSRYLNNEIIIADLRKSGDDPDPFVDDQDKVISNLKTKFQKILQTDFEEYNALPYSRYSLLAILNIAQFANHKDLREDARMVLDYITAKAAAGSDGGRRLVSYRRHNEVLRARGFLRLFDTVWESDHLIPYVMFYSGQTQHLWNNLLDLSMFEHMIYHASASIGDNTPGDVPPIPDTVVLEAAIEKSKPIEQRIRHTGVEIYSSGDGWLLSAGGVQAGPANFIIAPVPPFYDDNDLGAAWPTILFLSASGLDVVPMKDFIRIEGGKIIHKQESEDEARGRVLGDEGGGITEITNIFLQEGRWVGNGTDDKKNKKTFSIPDKTIETYDGNLCVGQGFACGFNLELPQLFESTTGGPGCGVSRPGGWKFFDTDTCYPNDKTRGTRAFVAVWRGQCPDPSTRAQCRNFGVLEAIGFNDPALAGVAEGSRFNTFIDRTVSRNRNLGVSAGSVLSTVDAEVNSTYTTVKEQSRGIPHSIRFEASFSGKTSEARIKSINGQERPSESGWKIADGNFIKGDSDGRIEIGWQTRNDGKPAVRLIIDFSDRDLSYRIPTPR